MQDKSYNFHKAVFFKSATSLNQCPQESKAEVAIVGRSNVGKSSFINCICSQKSLCKTSKTPGRTQMINYLSIGDTRFLVDLPGTGYAKTSKKIQKKWHYELNDYLKYRKPLKAIVLIVDIRRGITMLDEDMITMAYNYKLPIMIVLNKIDKISKSHSNSTKLQINKKYQGQIPLFLFSASKKIGISAVTTQMFFYFK
jgi:GTP-binding protein